MKNTWSLIIAAGVIVGVLFFVSSKGKKAPNIPADQIHQTVTAQEGCTVCHAPGKQSPLKDTHPPKEQCLTCHKTRKS